jgi:2-oxoglutarate ferredoxin oxidoreductase subunit alpha
MPQAAGADALLAMDGNQAVVLGALAAGVRFCSFYPMSPATSIAEGLARVAVDMGVVVEQAEDEIAALNMALGASYAGARSIVPTSGGGFALMVEAVSLAGVMETPVVVVLAQRPGPATGLPTRTEQGDLNLVLYAGHGEFPRAIFAPGNIDQCFHLAHRAFDQAELHQSPVFILTEQYLADSYRAVEPFDLDSLPEPVLPDFETADPDGYERYAFTESGVSPRLAPGFSKALVVADSHEHTPQGHITEDQEIRTRMVDKRLRKGRGLVEDAIPPDLYGDESPDTLLVCWGGALGPAVEAGELLRHQGDNVSVLHFSQVWPLNPDHFLPILRRAGRTVCVEGNATGQFAGLLRQETGFKVDALVLRYDGRPFTARYIMDRLPQAK